MALAYAFIDPTGIRHGEPSPSAPSREFPYIPSSGPFAGQRLTVHASSWEGIPSDTWMRATDGWRCRATEQVAELLGMDRALEGPAGISE